MSFFELKVCSSEARRVQKVYCPCTCTCNVVDDILWVAENL